MRDMDWIETHYEVVAFIERVMRHDDPWGVVADRHDAQGHGGLYELSVEWTDAFQEANKDRAWDGEFFDEIEKFLTEKNNGEPEFESVSLFSHVDGSKATGTSWHGAVVKASVNELTGILGDPSCVSNDGADKTNFEWWMEATNGDVFTIYDWKEYRKLTDDEPIEWHIGCHTSWIGASVSNLIMAELVRKEVGDGDL
jgi:hypothetical protein